jgi:antitoxin (DNA-binding transcriptional repressor) of toxin-antitoxin stability system
MYTSPMEVSITQFRRDMFDLVTQAMAGVDVYVTHKGRRFRIVPDEPPSSRLSRITPLEIINPESSEDDERALQEEMRAAWEKDWAEL